MYCASGDEGGATFDNARQNAFLLAYAKVGTVTGAAKAAGIGRRIHYVWLKRDASYKQRFIDARREAGDNLETEARRRALEGVRRPLVQGGKIVFASFDNEGNIVADNDPKAVRKGPVYESYHSDRLLEVLLRANLPLKYRERKQVEHTGKATVRFESKEEKLSRVMAALERVRGQNSALNN